MMTEWHNRYGGPGVMNYWPVKRRSTCIYSQLKSCSSSEGGLSLRNVVTSHQLEEWGAVMPLP